MNIAARHATYELDGDLGHSGGLTARGVRHLLMADVARAGNVNSWCKMHKIVHTAQVYEFLSGERLPGKAVLEALGLVKANVYVKMGKNNGSS
jgi:hypothetical protein